MEIRSIDIFCHVVDNFGDIGVVYRFAREFHSANPECIVRVFVDDLQALQAINPWIDSARSVQTFEGIDYIGYNALTPDFVKETDAADCLVEAFACHIPEVVLKAASKKPRLIINLEHLSAEPWVEGYHLKPSLLPDENIRKYFFMPGFTAATGGVIIDHRILRCRPRLAERRWLCLRGILAQAGRTVHSPEGSLVGTVFTYERGFDTMLCDLHNLQKPSLLLVFGQKSRQGMDATLERLGGRQIREHVREYGKVRIVFMPFIPQPRYDALLALVDFNIVRGEDSLVRAILAGRPFIWNAYVQDDTYQKVKVKALVSRMEEFFKGDTEAFSRFRELMVEFNCAGPGLLDQVTSERYRYFFTNLTKFTHATEEISYFLARNCDLVKQLSVFFSNL